MKRLVDLIIAERTVVAVILLNTLALLFISPSEDVGLPDQFWFAVDYGCVIYFILEAVLKVSRLGWSGYWRSGWNKFDLIIVLLSLPVLLSPVVQLHDFAAVLVLRLGRLFRLFRLLRFIPKLDKLAKGVREALKASVGVFLALGLVNLILSIGATMLFGRMAPEYFGDPITSMYSIFRVFTVEGWYEIPDVLAARAEHSGWAMAARGYFVLCVVLGGLLGLSLANAVFVDTMTADNNDSLERKVEELAAEIRSLRSELGQVRQADVQHVSAASAAAPQPATSGGGAASPGDCEEPPASV